MRRLIIRFADHFIIQGLAAETEVLGVYPQAEGRTILIHHGHWRDSYPARISREEARSGFGLDPDDFVFLFIGLCASPTRTWKV